MSGRIAPRFRDTFGAPLFIALVLVVSPLFTAWCAPALRAASDDDEQDAYLRCTWVMQQCQNHTSPTDPWYWAYGCFDAPKKCLNPGETEPPAPLRAPTRTLPTYKPPMSRIRVQ